MHLVVCKLGDDISTDVIYPGRFMATVLPSETPKFAFADDETFNARLRAGEIPKESVLVAGKNFGCGSSREQAASTLRGYDLIVVARGFARIFIQNAINLGLRTVTCPALEAEVGDELRLEGDAVVNVTSGRRFPIEPLPAARRAIVEAGGLIPYTRKRLTESRGV
ncbi:MAG TPA: 3-isopropylmalate dehydratase small subunit [Thermoanaerobaculia bacterium]|nr:3-isopropylmalate dehydratase small subunit [Thermoanaerobaculia bacterium]